jgi:putative transcriptional regulator
MQDLTGKLLIAMPGMTDPRFERSVILLCEHTPDGAMGLIVNKVAADVDVASLLERLEIRARPDVKLPLLNFGGPVDTGRGFVLHSHEYAAEAATLAVTPELSLTATVEILHDIANGTGPEKAILALGYSGWGGGQLEAEIQANGWLTAESNAALVLGSDPSIKWSAALGTLGIDPLTLSATAGRA